MCVSHLIYTVRPCLIHTCHAMPMPCSVHPAFLKATAQHGRLSRAVLCCGLEKNGMVRAWHGHGMASVNQTRPHCVNQMGKTHSKTLAARHGRDMGTAWARHGHGMVTACYVWIDLNAWFCGRLLAGTADSNSNGTWMSREFCVLSGRGLSVGLITRPEESYQM